MSSEATPLGHIKMLNGEWVMWTGEVWSPIPALPDLPHFVPREKNKGCNEDQSSNYPQETIMTENINLKTVPETETPEVETIVEPTFLQKLTIKHPRASKAVAITGGILAVTAVAMMINNMRNGDLIEGSDSELSLDELQKMSESMPAEDTTN